MLEHIESILERAIAEKVLPGCVVGIVDTSGKTEIVPYGRYTYEGNSRAMENGALFDVASVTKAIPTSTLALQLIDRGKLKTDDPVLHYLPDLQNNYQKQILVRHLLTQTLDFSFPLSKYKDLQPAEILRTILTSDLASPPGTTFYYSNATSILLGLLVEKITGKPLHQTAQEELFEPLGMSATTFQPLNVRRREEIVPTEKDEHWRKRLIQGEIHDESAYTISQERFVGSAGLFSTVPNLLLFLRMLLNHGTMGEKSYLSPAMVERIYQNQIDHLNLSHGLGWELNQQRYMGEKCSVNTFGKTGFTGCMVLCDIPRKLGIVMLSNRTYPVRQESVAGIHRVRQEIADAIWTRM